MQRSQQFIKYIIDQLILICTFYLAIYLRSVTSFSIFKYTMEYTPTYSLMMMIVFMVPVSSFLYYVFGSYENRLSFKYSGLLLRLTVINLTLFFYVISLVYFSHKVDIPRSITITSVVLNLVFLFVFRAIFAFFSRFAKAKNVVIYGNNIESRMIIDELTNFQDFKISLVGVVAESKSRLPKGIDYLGGISKIKEVSEKVCADIIIICADSLKEKQQMLDNVTHQSFRYVKIFMAPSTYEIMISKPDYLRIKDIPLIPVNNYMGRIYNLKRFFDFIMALFLLVISSPMFFLVALIIKLTSEGPVIYRQKRVGRYETNFTLYKFRTMFYKKDEKASQAKKDDPRITSVGKFLRGLRLDEFPQLINILKGEMSFVGPRPLIVSEVTASKKSTPGFAERFLAIPGLTGLAQIHGTYFTVANQKLKYDLWYIYHYSFSMDIILFVKTIKTVLLRKGS